MPLRADARGHTPHWPHRTRLGDSTRRRRLTAHRATRLRAKTKEAKQSWTNRRTQRAEAGAARSYSAAGTETPLDQLNQLAARRNSRRPHRRREHMKSYIRYKAHRTGRHADSVRKHTRIRITHSETVTTREYLRAKAHRARLRAEGIAAKKRESWSSEKSQRNRGGPRSPSLSPTYLAMSPEREEVLRSNRMDAHTRITSMPLPVRRNTMSDSEQDDMGEPSYHQSRLHRHIRRRRTEGGGILH